MKEFNDNIDTLRLKLNRFKLEDSIAVNELLKDKEISDNTLNIPYPYKEDMANKWISDQAKKIEEKKSAVWAIRVSKGSNLIGCISLEIDLNHLNAELGYWVGKNHWQCGYCTEAAKAVIQYAFTRLKINKVFAYHLAKNAPSGRVLQKIGMTQEGYLKEHRIKQGSFQDVKIFALLKSEIKSN